MIKLYTGRIQTDVRAHCPTNAEYQAFCNIYQLPQKYLLLLVANILNFTSVCEILQMAK